MIAIYQQRLRPLRPCEGQLYLLARACEWRISNPEQEIVMPKISTAKAISTYGELSKFVARQDVVDALEKAAKNQALFRKVKTDAGAFLRSEGIKVPPRTQISVSRQVEVPTRRILFCVYVCRQVGRFLLCTRICIPIVRAVTLG
jgi:hypothetical protein